MAAEKRGSAPVKAMAMTLDSREGTTSSFFSSTSASHCSIVPLPSVAAMNCSRVPGLSASFSMRTTFCATFALWITSTWVAM